MFRSHSFASRSVRLLVPCALFVAALVLRVWALDWGLPYVEHPDEPALLAIAIQMLRNGEPNPHSFLYPSLFFYLLAAVIQLHTWWGINQGWYTSFADLAVSHHRFTVAPQLFVWTRAISALLGAATVPALYLLGCRMFDKRIGVVAGLALMVAPFHIEHSHYVTTDVSTGLWVVLAAVGAWEITTGGSWRSYLLAGLMTGLAAGTKYNAGTVVLAVPIAHLLFWRRESFGRPLLRLVASGAAAVLALLATTPFALLDWPSFLEGLRFNAAHYAAGNHGDFIGRWQIAEYVTFLWRKALLPPGLILAAVAPLLLRGRARQALLLLTIVGVAMLLLLSYKVNFVRNMLPVFPLFVLLSAIGTVGLADMLRSAPIRWLVLVPLAMLLLAPLTRDSLWLLRYWSRPYTMQTAAEQIRNVPQGMRIAVEMHATQWAGVPNVFPVSRLTDQTVDWYQTNGFRYVVASDDFRTAGDRVHYEELKSTATVLVEYPERRAGLQLGPGGAILDLGEHVAEMPFVRRPMEFGDQLVLLGYEMQPGAPRERISPLEGADVRVLAPEEPLQINLYWRALRRPPLDYTLFVHVVDSAGNRVSQRDLPLRYPDYQSARWQPNELVVDRADLVLPALPAGDYQLLIGLYDPASFATLPPNTNNGVLTTITVH